MMTDSFQDSLPMYLRGFHSVQEKLIFSIGNAFFNTGRNRTYSKKGGLKHIRRCELGHVPFSHLSSIEKYTPIPCSASTPKVIPPIITFSLGFNRSPHAFFQLGLTGIRCFNSLSNWVIDSEFFTSAF